MAIIILVRDVIMVTAVEIVAQRQLLLIQTVVQMQTVGQIALGTGLMVIQIPILREPIVPKVPQLPQPHHHLRGEAILQVEVRLVAHQAVRQVEVLVEGVQEVQDNINKRLTSKIPLKATLRGFFRL